MGLNIFESGALVIAALHLPSFVLSRHRSMAWFEDFTVANARIFAEAGIPWIKLQDQTRTTSAASPETVAKMAALGRLVRTELPHLGLGIIIEAHDARAALSTAAAVGAGFVRLKVFVGGAMTADGPRQALGADAVAYRAELARPDIAILADVHDRTARPLSDESQPFAAEWAGKVGADGLIITGADFADTLGRIQAVRQAVPGRPVLVGGGVSEANVAEALAASDGVIVSSALMRKGAADDDVIRWDADLCRRFMDAARQS